MTSVVRSALKAIKEKGIGNFLRELREEGYTLVYLLQPLFFFCLFQILFNWVRPFIAYMWDLGSLLTVWFWMDSFLCQPKHLEYDMTWSVLIFQCFSYLDCTICLISEKWKHIHRNYIICENAGNILPPEMSISPPIVPVYGNPWKLRWYKIKDICELN